MKILACAYPPDWAPRETLALPVFLDQLPPRGLAGRIDFRLNGLVSGLILEQLLNKDDPWLLLNPERMVAPELLLVPIESHEQLDLARSERWFSKTADKLFAAGARSFSLALQDLYRPEFPVREFAGGLLRSLLGHEFEVVKFYTDLELAEKLLQEFNRWLYHYQSKTPVEFMRKDYPEVFEAKEP